MSETMDAVAAAAAEADAAAQAEAAAAAEAQAAEAAAAGDQAAEAAAAEAAETAAAETKKPTRQERHVANLTRKAAEEARRAEAAERRAEAAEALLAAGKTEDGDKPLTPPAARTTPATDVEARAAQLVAEREFNKRLGEIDAAGKKDLGADAWEAAKATLTGLGAVNNKAFLEALAETEHPAKIFAAMADDTDALMDLLKQTPAKMATRLGRMDADLSKPAPRPLSGAPKPGARVDSGGVLPVVDIYDPKISVADLDKELDKMPVHLGGKRKAA